MAVSATNLLAGPGTMYRGDVGATEPLDTAIGSAPGVGWTDLGATDGGLTMTVSREMFKLRMDQTTEAPSRRVTERDVTLATALAEVTLENYALAWGQPSSGITAGTGFKAVDLSGAQDVNGEPRMDALLWDGYGPGGLRRRIIARKCLNSESVESAYKKDEQTFIPVTFAAHWVSASVKSVRIIDAVAV